MLQTSFPDQFIRETLKQSPIRKLRGYRSQQEAASLCNMGINTYYLYEVAVYTQPSDSIVNGLIADRTQIIPLYSDYKRHQTWKRKLFLEKLGSEVVIKALEDSHSSSRVSPIQSLINSLGCSNIAFCKMFCINPGHIAKLIGGKLFKLPDAMENCFMDLGLGIAELDEINERLKEFQYA